MNKRRLLKLADLLEADANNKTGMKFDIGTVAEPANRKSTMPAADCGTVGCAMGLAAVSGAFKRSGGLDYVVKPCGLDPETPWRIDLTMHGKEMGFDDAAEMLFDITSEQGEYLFNPCSYNGEVKGAKGERKVAKRIRNFVEDGDTFEPRTVTNGI